MCANVSWTSSYVKWSVRKVTCNFSNRGGDIDAKLLVWDYDKYPNIIKSNSIPFIVDIRENIVIWKGLSLDSFFPCSVLRLVQSSIQRPKTFTVETIWQRFYICDVVLYFTYWVNSFDKWHLASSAEWIVKRTVRSLSIRVDVLLNRCKYFCNVQITARLRGFQRDLLASYQACWQIPDHVDVLDQWLSNWWLSGSKSKEN